MSHFSLAFFLGVLLASGVIWGCFADLIFTPDLLLFLQPNGAEKVQLAEGSRQQEAAQAACRLGQLDMQTTLSFITNFDIDAGKARESETERARTKNQNKISCRLSMLLMTNFRRGKISHQYAMEN